jgi:hypothetical protein
MDYKIIPEKGEKMETKHHGKKHRNYGSTAIGYK